MARIENLVEHESGPKFVQTGRYKGAEIEVVTGYYVVDNNYPVHVFATKPGEGKVKVGTGKAELKQDALDWGFQRGAAWIDTGK